MTEEIIAFHCGPALAGIKPANIVSCIKEKCPNINQEIKELNLSLNKNGIYFETLYECEKRVLVMVYRREKLTNYLSNPDIFGFLKKQGYPDVFNLEEYINMLKKRIAECSEFPHEIGAFLGYPLHDIYGFMYHKDKGCMLTGYWKVYKNVEEAKRTFSVYDACRKAILNRVNSGWHLTEMFAVT